MVSIKDIAKRAGVSISTVSYALNGNPKVNAETSSRILEIANEMNYVPNAAARTLKKRQTMIVGAFITSFEGSFYGELLQGMKDMLNKQGYDLIICSGTQSHRLLPEGMLDGAIILDAKFDSDELLRYANRGHKLVVLDRELNHKNISQVLLDNKAGATLAAEYLIESGYRKIYVVTGPEGSFDAEQRLKAVRLTMERNQPLDYIEIQGDFNQSGGVRAARQIMAEYSGPAGVFCLNDEMAIGLYRELKDSSSYTIGKNLSVIGFDNIETARYLQPQLASIDYSKRRWGAVASEQLLNLIAGGQAVHERIYVNLIKANSVRKAED
ncbi:LacI family DNA-binding transcriptional regulator [Paenibacillus sp. 1001270B_150601_E10]|uniref:LacI family DNA-binding transcriptional regulator n=1 Tax=Paenibacillus sp. 1001270B_150601_E10 TaxID=2787079 RepID=UPI00189C6FEF|nr:LacI family DNA-binding transcriptional regulator [Paenibacillus sp. 1001270B_150601_E10]